MGLDESLRRDVDRVARLDAVTTILDVVGRVTDMGFVAVARVTEDRWICCRSIDRIGFGLTTGGELEIETTICNEIRQHPEPVVIEHVASDEAYCGHPTPARYGFQSYVSYPIIQRNGAFFGTLCAIDPRPRRLRTPEVEGMFRLFGDLIAFHLDVHDRLAASEAALSDAAETATLREQFMAVLGHDLRNPLNALRTSTHVLRTMPHADASVVLARMARSVDRMSELVSNLTDLAQSRLGGGLLMHRTRDRGLLQGELQQVVEELSVAWPTRTITARLDVNCDVAVDVSRMGQLLSNLVSNALTHGTPERAVEVLAEGDAERFRLSVTNRGAAIPGAARERLFQPFTRGAAGSGDQGLGLGLYIVAEIARAHGGAIHVHSESDVTRFTFEMPVTPH